ncbi:MAG: WG repeat-containing protein [Cyclobacteriaceae bacterium]|nr:WG repeat-containing protein [Cyclobacteriaceae bacterium]
MSLMSLSDNVELTWDDVTLYGLDMLIVRKESLYNLVSPQGELISPQWYSQLTFSGSSKPLIASLDGKYGLIDKAGRVLLRFNYEYLESTTDDGKVFLAKKHGKYAFISREGKEITHFNFLKPYRIENYYVVVSNNFKTGILSSSGQVLVPADQDEIVNLRNFILIRKHNSSQLLNRYTLQPITETFDEIQPVDFNDGSSERTFFITTKSGRKGILGEYANTIIENNYNDIVMYGKQNNRLMLATPLIVAKNGKYGLIDIDQNVILEFGYDSIMLLNSQLAIVQLGNRFGLIEISNPPNLLLPIEYQFLSAKEDKLVGYRSKFYTYKIQGNRIIENSENEK